MTHLLADDNDDASAAALTALRGDATAVPEWGDQQWTRAADGRNVPYIADIPYVAICGLWLLTLKTGERSAS